MRDLIFTWHQFFDVLFVALQPENVLAVRLKTSEAKFAAGLARRLFGVADASCKATSPI